MPDLMAKMGFGEFVARAGREGMPVRFLREVSLSNYSYEYGEDDEVGPFLNTMTLRRDTLRSASTASLSNSWSEATAVQTVYHEATHAWFDIMSDRPDVAAVIAHGRTYYTDAPMKNGARANDPNRVFQEAAGCYVGLRASTYWASLEDLMSIQRECEAKNEANPKLKAWFRKVPQEYETEMARLVVGYQTRSWLDQKQIDTVKVISKRLKEFCDRVLLESLVPDQFRASVRLLELHMQLAKRWPQLTH